MTNFIYTYMVPSQKVQNRSMHVGESDNETISYTKIMRKNLYLALKMKLWLETAWA